MNTLLWALFINYIIGTLFCLGALMIVKFPVKIERTTGSVTISLCINIGLLVWVAHYLFGGAQ